MKISYTQFAAISLLLLFAVGFAPVCAEEPATPQDDAAADGTPDETPVAAAADTTSSGVPFGLYVEFAGGVGGADPIEMNIFSEADIAAGLGDFEVKDTIYGRAAVGWKFPNAKGSVRLVFQGHKEDGYNFRTQGSLSVVTSPGPDLDVDPDSGLAPWWFVSVKNGQLTSTRLTPFWDETLNDTDGDLLPDSGPCSAVDAMGMMSCGELQYDTTAPAQVITGNYPDDLQNRINTYDLVYGREFGGRKINSHWFAGLRYFQYEGQLLGGAWLAFGAPVGEGFTDGGFLRLLRISQETTGAGPVGSWEVRYNTLQQALQLFAKAEVAFTLNDLSIDTDPFFQVDVEQGVLIEDRLQKSIEKSTWQNKLELGARLHFKNGLHVEVAYGLTGYLDFVLVPDLVQLQVTNPRPQTNSQDIVIDTLHFGAGFQF